MRKTGLLLWLVLIAILAAGVMSMLAFLRPQSRQAVIGSTYEAGPKGAKAAYLFLRANGVLAGRYRQAWGPSLPDSGYEVIVVSEPRIPFGTRERIAIRGWVYGGGTLLLQATEPWKIWPIGGSGQYGTSIQETFSPLVPTDLTAGISGFGLTSLRRLKGPYSPRKPAGPPVVLAGDRYGAAILVFTYGQGRVVMVADPQFFSNRRLKNHSDHAIFLMNVINSAGRGKRVAFDEYHLGYGKAAAPVEASSAFPMILSLILAQLVLLTGLFFFTRGRRFGRPVAMPETGGRTITEYITSLATLYQRADAGAVALNYLYQGLLERMRQLTGVSPAADLSVLAEAASRRLGEDPRDLTRLLSQCRAAQTRNRLAAGELMHLARRLDYYRRELEKWVTPRR